MGPRDSNKEISMEKDEGRLPENIMNFGRVLRAAGLPIGPGQIIMAAKSVAQIGITDREIFYWTLHAVYVNRREHREIFDQAFHIFWKNPHLLERMMQMVLPTFKTGGAKTNDKEIIRRVSDALNQEVNQQQQNKADIGEQEIELDAVMTFSDTEILQDMDFEKMTAIELESARIAISRLILPLKEIPSRRYTLNAPSGIVDLQNTLRASLKRAGDDIPLKYKRIRTKPPALIALCDISGSMTRYSRMLLHFMHTITNARSEVHTFLFGTRLTNVTRYLRNKDVDDSLEKASQAVNDWSGGTRIGECLHDFNLRWARRVLSRGSIVLLISDGLDRDAGIGLSKEVDKIKRSCNRLIWLNPLLRFDQFSPKSMGVRAILPYVDEFRPVHSLNSLAELAEALGKNHLNDKSQMTGWIKKLNEVEIGINHGVE
ncbi:VWA domain-containing protein [Rhodospirillaceae bacterium]|nr:VWA domain-containing protein [Alphaproteobacteria bacterium]MDC1441584.1 VWA domain-containing protein [Rhodospirillaceae bacterium]